MIIHIHTHTHTECVKSSKYKLGLGIKGVRWWCFVHLCTMSQDKVFLFCFTTSFHTSLYFPQIRTLSCITTMHFFQSGNQCWHNIVIGCTDTILVSPNVPMMPHLPFGPGPCSGAFGCHVSSFSFHLGQLIILVFHTLDCMNEDSFHYIGWPSTCLMLSKKYHRNCAVFFLVY